MRGIIFNNHEINEASRDRATNGKELKEEMKRKKKENFHYSIQIWQIYTGEGCLV